MEKLIDESGRVKDFGLVADNILQILYPSNSTEAEVDTICNDLKKLFSETPLTTDKIETIKILNTEVSVRLFLTLIEISGENDVCILLSRTAYNQFQVKKETVANLFKFDTKLIKAYDE